MNVLQILAKKNMLIALLMGFSSGLPLLLTSKTLQAWMATEGVDLKTIGLFAAAGIPYTLKFLWAPLMDRFAPPFLGRRRGWLFLSQIALLITIAVMGFSQPKEDLWSVAFIAVLVSFFSASQDIVVDAFRRESLSDEELGLASTLYIYGYRVAIWITGACALILSDHMSWKEVYFLMAAVMIVGIVTTLWSDEPPMVGAPPRTLKETVVDPLADFFLRPGAIMILAFILLYKLGDTMAGAMATPFYIQLGFTKTEIGVIAKTFGLFSTLGGGLVGGILLLKYGINRCLWIFGILQAASTFGFAALAQIGANSAALAGVIAFEDFSGGMGTTAYVAFMASLTNRRFTATQYALLSSLMGIPRTLVSAPTGWMAQNLGWQAFFIACVLLAIPGLLLLTKIQKLKETPTPSERCG